MFMITSASMWLYSLFLSTFSFSLSSSCFPNPAKKFSGDVDLVGSPRRPLPCLCSFCKEQQNEEILSNFS